MQFKDIVGQKTLINKLIQTTKDGRISHAQLFLGAEGSGNLALAIAYAQYVNCLNQQETDSCGTCSSCVKYQKYIHPDLHFTFPTILIDKKKLSLDFIAEFREALLENPYMNDFDWICQLDNAGNKQGNITAEECRDIIRKLSLKAYEAKFKTLIIWMPEYMKTEGNIILKLLEEPPENTLIILVANDSEKVLATILSRAQLIKVPQVLDDDIVNNLIQNHQIESNKAQAIARLVSGNYNLALSLINIEHGDYLNLFIDWMRKSFAYKKDIKVGQPDELTLLIEKLSTVGREQVKSFLTYSSQMIRSAFIYKFGHPSLRKNSAQELAFLNQFSVVFTPNNLALITTAIDEAIFHVERNASVKIMYLNLSMYIGKQLQKATIKK
jgi:DNA polymerase-3 subunit delta'